jgi:YD repeat-containing protein
VSNNKLNSAVKITSRDGQTVWEGNVHNSPEFQGTDGRVIQLFDADSKTTWTLFLAAGDTVEITDLL